MFVAEYIKIDNNNDNNINIAANNNNNIKWIYKYTHLILYNHSHSCLYIKLHLCPFCASVLLKTKEEHYTINNVTDVQLAYHILPL